MSKSPTFRGKMLKDGIDGSDDLFRVVGSLSTSGTPGKSSLTPDLLKKAMDILGKKSATPAKPMSAIGGVPLTTAWVSEETRSWRMNSMAWLEENHPEYCRGRPSEGARDRLIKSLAAMSYVEAESSRWPSVLAEPGSLLPHQALIDLVDNWNETEHRAMVDFLDKGGYAAAVTRKGAEAMTKKESAESVLARKAAMTSDEIKEMLNSAGAKSKSELPYRKGVQEEPLRGEKGADGVWQPEDDGLQLDDIVAAELGKGGAW